MAARFVPNPNLANDVGNLPGVRRAVLGAAIEVRKGIAAELPSGASGGRRVAPFSKRAYADLSGETGRNVSAQVGTRWRLAHLIEFGSVNNQPFAPLRRAALKTGLRFQPHGKGGA
jgi:hypothetical protein